jgi:putative integral membrane protein (TIGR02587 family)
LAVRNAQTQANSPSSTQADRGWGRELGNLLQGISGGFLFGIPLLYTVEVWWIGSAVRPSWMLAALAVALAVIFLLNQSEGFRGRSDIRSLDALLESIEALAISMACSGLALGLLGRITLATPLTEALGKLIFEGIPFAIGVALARSTFLGRRDRAPRRQTQANRTARPGWGTVLARLDATLIGALIVGFNIAPTEEVPLLAASLPPLQLLAVVAASLLVSYGIVFASGWGDRDGGWRQAASETLVGYVACLLVSALMLGFFQQLSWADPWQEWLSETLLLGLPAAVGGAAGRLAI